MSENVDGAVKPGVQDEPKQFSQSELNAIIQDRLKRATEKYADYDSLKSQVEQLAADKKKLEEAELSELEKAQSKVKELEDKFSVIKAEAEAYKSQVTEWELEQSAAVEDAMKEFSDEDKALVNELPLGKRMKLVEKMKAAPKPGPGSWGKGPNSENLTLKAIMDKKEKGDPSWAEDYRKYRNRA